MPKKGAMTQISRPFQIALAAMALLVAVWFIALRGHSSGSESSGSAASSSAQPATPQQASGSSSGSGSGGSSGSASSPSSTYHGSAPGVAGLTRAIAKARGAVAQSEQSARQSQQSTEKASSSGSTQSGQTSSTSASHAGSSTSSPAKAAPHGAVKTKPGASGAGTHAKSGVPAMQLQVEGQLKHGKTVAILFWNPQGSVDAVVHRELQAAASKFAGKLAVHNARSSQVGSFGTFTRAVQVYSTPTILLINTKGVTSSVTGLTDVFSIEQAVGEVKRAR
jgi:hypothetical protein